MSEIKRPSEVMILAAGLGKRLNPLTLSTPKPLIHLQGKSFLERVLEKLSPLSFQNIVINTHYLADQIHQFLQEIPSRLDLPPIQISHETEILEVGGGIANALPLFKKYPFYTVNSDIWWEESDPAYCPFTQLAKAWDPEKMDGLLLLVSKENALFYKGRGDFYRPEDGVLVMRDQVNLEDDPPYIYTGIQLLHPRLLDGRTGAYALGSCFREACQKGRLYGVEFQGKWCDAGTLDSLNRLGEYLT